MKKKPTCMASYVGKRITLFCVNYIYTGDLVAVDDMCVTLDKPAIVYETGPFTTPAWQDAQSLPHTINVMITAVESFGEMK